MEGVPGRYMSRSIQARRRRVGEAVQLPIRKLTWTIGYGAGAAMATIG